MYKEYNTKMYKHSSKNLSREENISREKEAHRREVENLKEAIKTVEQRKAVVYIPQPPTIIEKVVEKVIVKEVLIEKEVGAKVEPVILKVEEAPKIQKEISRIEEAPKTEEIKTDEPKTIKTRSVKTQSALKVVLSVMISFFVVAAIFAFVGEGEYHGSTVGLTRQQINESMAKKAASTPASNTTYQAGVHRSSLLVAGAQPSQTKGVEPTYRGVEYQMDVKSVSDPVVKANLIRLTTIRNLRNLRTQELVDLHNRISELSDKKEKILEDATKETNDLHEKKKVEIEALRKEGKGKEADKLQTKTNSKIKNKLSRAESEAKKIVPALDALSDRQAVLDKEEQEQTAEEATLVGVGRVENKITTPVLQQPTQTVGNPSVVSSFTPQQKEDRFVYIISLNSNPLVVREVVDGKVSEKSLVVTKIGRYSYAKYTGGVGLQVERQGDNKPIIDGKQFFIAGRWFWVFDGERMVRKDTVPSGLFERLTAGEGS